MNINECKRKTKDEAKIITVSVRVSKTESEWMTENNISPSKVFTLALAELMKE